jgi:acyl-CoA dehydrogenase
MAAAWRPPPRCTSTCSGRTPSWCTARRSRSRNGIPRLVAGSDQCCFGFTEPDAGLNTTRIKTFAEKVPGGYRVRGQKVWTSTAQVANKIMLLTRTTAFEDVMRPTDGITIFYTDLDRTRIEVRRIAKMGRKAVDSNAIFIDDLFVPEEHRIGQEGRGFSYILDSLNPERVLVAMEAIGIGQDALRRATKYAANESCSIASSARTRASSIRWPSAGCISNWRT